MTPPDIISSEENIPSIQPLYDSLYKLLDENLHLSIEELGVAHDEYQEAGHKLKRDKLTQEDDITNVICRFLSELESGFYFEFQTKDPEKNGGADIGIFKKFTKPKHVPLCYIEAKVLPTPITSNKRQETEYVCYRKSKKQGGIERFKTGTHAPRTPLCIMFAYIQKENFAHWFNKINFWISEEIASSSNSSITWLNEDLLIPEDEFNQENVAKYNSIHTRISPLKKIGLTHYWINLS